jgi:hypothetical protein
MSTEIPEHKLPKWAKELTALFEKDRPPSYVKVLSLPALVPHHDLDAEYDFEVTGGLVSSLAREYVEPSKTALRAISECTPGSCADLGRALLDVWANKGHTMTYKWILWAQIPLGGVGSIVELERLVEEWVFGTSAQRDRACEIIRVLGRKGTPEALTVVDRYRQIERSPKVHGAATQAFASAAKRLGVTPQELEDRIVPDYGLDARGRRTFDYGPRQFELVFREHLYPALRDEDGKIHKSPPRSRKTDDAAKVAEVKRAWSDLGEHLKRAGRVHRTRMERYMVAGRRWRAEDWDAAIRHHPFMQHFARNLLWGVYTSDDRLKHTFCVSNDLSLTDREDEEVTLRPNDRVGIVHPIELKNTERIGWSNLFAEDERFEPFEQLGRALHALPAREASDAALTHFSEQIVQPRALRTYFKYQGFHRGEPDGYMRKRYYKDFSEEGWRYTVHLEPGLQVGSYEGDQEQSIARLSFSHGRPKRDVALREVPSRFLSEAMRDVERILAKG